MTTFTEFQPLKEIIVGSTFDFNNFKNLPDKETYDCFRKINEETAEDLEELVKILQSFGVKVYRPNNLANYDCNYDAIKTPWFKMAFPNHPLMPRDVLGVFGDTILEMFTGSTGRFFENLSYRDICQGFFDKGYRWCSMPMPLMSDSNIVYKESNQILYHAANIIKCGKDLFYTHSGKDHQRGKGTNQGLEWIKKELGNSYRWNNINVGGHCDGKVALLQPGLAMTWNESWIPPKMHKWDILEVDSKTVLPDSFLNIRKQRWYKNFIQEYLDHWIGYVDETVFDVNVLSIDENNIIFTGKNSQVFKILEKRGINPIYWNFRHQYFWDGGVHCVTQDLVRKGNQEDYFE